MPSELECAMESLITMFHRYAGKDTNTLSRRELRELMENELSTFLKEDPAAVDKIMKDLDTERKDVLDFDMFLSLLARFLMANN
uniref:S100/CaBP-9k-type calcium binding subdomain domain-containing protein n=1 Tax=Monopterus albus TaxID=43700 RepID=A0A3Q3IW16_MONAL